MNKKTLSKIEILEAFKKTDGNVMRSAELLEVNHQTIYNYIGQDEDLENKLYEIRRGSAIKELDIAESVIKRVQHMVESKTGYALRAAMYHLDTHGKKRGYVKDLNPTDTAPNDNQIDQALENMKLKATIEQLKAKLDANKS